LKWTQTTTESIPHTTNIITDFRPLEAAGTRDCDAEDGPRPKRRKTSYGIKALDIDYEPVKPHVEKGKDITEFEREGSCTICLSSCEHDSGVYAICPTPSCESVTHLTCLSKHFLSSEDEDSLVPITGTCPCCKTESRWVDVVKELTLRIRGEKEIAKLLKPKRARTGKSSTLSEVTIESSASDAEDADDVELSDELEKLREFHPAIMSDGWQVISDSEESDTGSITSNASQAKESTIKGASKPAMLPIVIEDSDWDDAQVLD
jgi:structure-specific endonuclease subunit SLX1